MSTPVCCCTGHASSAARRSGKWAPNSGSSQVPTEAIWYSATAVYPGRFGAQHLPSAGYLSDLHRAHMLTQTAARAAVWIAWPANIVLDQSPTVKRKVSYANLQRVVVSVENPSPGLTGISTMGPVGCMAHSVCQGGTNSHCKADRIQDHGCKLTHPAPLSNTHLAGERRLRRPRTPRACLLPLACHCRPCKCRCCKQKSLRE